MIALEKMQAAEQEAKLKHQNELEEKQEKFQVSIFQVAFHNSRTIFALEQIVYSSDSV